MVAAPCPPWLPRDPKESAEWDLGIELGLLTVFSPSRIFLVLAILSQARAVADATDEYTLSA